MKVGVNTLFLIPGEVGGTETYLRQTLKAIAGHFPDVSLVLFTNRENESVLRKDLRSSGNVCFELLDFAATNRHVRILREQVELPGRVRRSGIDVLWSPGYTAPFFCSCPQVVTIPDMQYKTFPQDLTFTARMVTDILVKCATRRCRRIIAISEFSRDEITKYTHAGKDRIDVVPLAADESFGDTIPQEKRKSLMASLIPEDRPYLLSVANTYPHKNIHSLVEAFGKLENRLSHNLVIVGNPRLGEDEVQKALGGLCDRNRVIRLNKLSSEQMVCLYQGCDIFVFPSLYEGFGLPVLEAMMAGVPVLTTKNASIPEVGGDGVSYFDPRERDDLAVKIQQIIGLSRQERDSMVGRAREIAKKFCWKRTAQKSLDVMRKALE